MVPVSLYLALLGTSTLVGSAVASKTLPLKFTRRPTFNRISKRSTSAYPVYLDDYIPYGEYYVTVAVGTPPQDIELVLDTGSSDLWMFGKGSCEVTNGGGSSSGTRGCGGGVFNPSQSSTFQTVASNAFSEQYADNSYVKGDYIKDTVQIGGMTLTAQEMGLAVSEKKENTGIMGVAFTSGESGATSGTYPEYPNVVANMVNQGLINSRAFSLYLDNLAAGHGQIIFGGYDKKKFSGDLVMLPVEPSEQDGQINSFTVSFTSLSVTSNGQSVTLKSHDFPHAAVLDSGTTYTYVPDDLFAALQNTLHLQPYNVQGQTMYLIDCNFGKKNPGLTLDFGFGGPGGAIIAVPVAEFVVPYYYPNNGSLSSQCTSGFQPRGSLIATLFGQTFLRSAYVLYDEDTPLVGIAPTVFDQSSSVIVEYSPQGGNSNVRYDSSAPTVPFTSPGGAQPTVNPGNGGSALFSSSIAGSSAAPPPSGGVQTVATNLAITRSYPSSQLPTTYPTSLGPQTAAPGSGGSGHSAANPAVAFDTRMLGMGLSVLAFVLFGGALLA